MSKPTSIRKSDLEVVEKGNMPGLFSGVEVILAADVLFFPALDEDGVTLSEQILVKPDIETGIWYFSPKTAELKCTDVSPKGATVYRNLLEFSIPTNKGKVLQQIRQLIGKKIIVSVWEHNRQRRIIGTALRPATLKGDATTGRTRTDRKEVVFTVEAFDSKPAIIFTSTFRTTTPPNVPVAFLAAQDASNIVLSWVDSSDNETGFEVWRSTDNVLFSLLATTAENATTYADTVAVNTVYWYKIRAVNEVYQSPYTLVRTGAILSAPTSLLAAKGTTDGTIFVGWTNTHGAAATAVELYRKIGAGSFALLATLGASAESYEDTYVITDSISREYRVRATRGSFVSPDSNTDAVSIPAQVTGLTLTHQGAGVVLVSWTDVGAIETGYEIEYSPNGTTGWTNVGSTPANDTSELLALAENATSHIRVRATGDSPGAWSDVASIAIPAAPTLLTADYLGLGEILLSWQDNATNETAQRLEYSTNGTSWSTLIVLAADVETYIHTGRAVNASHFYRVRAESATANSAYSNTAQVAIPATPTGLVVAQPTAINATTPQPNMLRITWTDAATNETAYEVYRHTSSMTDPEAQGTLLATLPAGTTAYNDLTTADGTTYFYAVRAITATAEGAFVQTSGKSLDVTLLEVQPSAVTNGRKIQASISKTGTAVFWDWGDGSAIVQGNTGTYEYASAGTYNVKMYAEKGTVASIETRNGRWSYNINIIQQFPSLISITGDFPTTGYVNNIVTGSIVGVMPSSLQILVFAGSNTISGSLAAGVLPAGLVNFQVQGNNTISGSLAAGVLPAGLVTFRLGGNNTISGTLAAGILPSTLITFVLEGSNTLTGALAAGVLPSTLVTFQVFGSNTLTGALAAGIFPNTLAIFNVAGSNTISGTLNVGVLPNPIIFFILQGNNTVTLANLSAPSLIRFDLRGQCIATGAVVSDVAANNYREFRLRPASGQGMATAQVDAALIALNNEIATSSTERIIDFSGNNAPRSSSSDAAVAGLQAKGFTVITN